MTTKPAILVIRVLGSDKILAFEAAGVKSGEYEGVHSLVMQYLEGETQAERLKRGPLPLDLHSRGFAVRYNRRATTISADAGSS